MFCYNVFCWTSLCSFFCHVWFPSLLFVVLLRCRSCFSRARLITCEAIGGESHDVADVACQTDGADALNVGIAMTVRVAAVAFDDDFGADVSLRL